MYANLTRENDVTALDTKTSLTELGANSPGTVDVPQAGMLTGIKISVAPDWTADSLLGYSTAIQLEGSGIGGLQSYPGPCGATGGAAATSSGLNIKNPQRYKVKIPVVPGQGIDIAGFLHGEDIGSIRMAVTLEFDGVPGIIKDMDYREADITAANTLTILANKLGRAEAYIQPSSRQIGEIHVNAGVKVVAGPLATVAVYELFGPAIPTGSVHEMVGPGISVQDDATISPTSNQVTSEVYQVPPGKLVLTSGNRFQARCQGIEDDVGTIFAIMGIGYI